MVVFMAYARAKAHGAEVQVSIGLGTEGAEVLVSIFLKTMKHTTIPQKTYIITFKYQSIILSSPNP